MLHYHRHGRGKVHVTAEVCPDTILDNTSSVGPKAHVWRSVLTDSIVISGDVLNSTLNDSTVRDSKVYGTYVERSAIINATLQGGRVIGCIVKGGAVQGDAVLVGITVDRLMRIGTGTWTRTPRYLEINDETANFGVTESTNGFAYIACQRKPMAVWIKGKDRFAKVMGWPTSLTDEIAGVLQQWLDEPIPTN